VAPGCGDITQAAAHARRIFAFDFTLELALHVVDSVREHVVGVRHRVGDVLHGRCRSCPSARDDKACPSTGDRWKAAARTSRYRCCASIRAAPHAESLRSALKRLKDLAWSGVAQRRQSNLNDNIADVIMGSGPLKADTVGKSAMVPAILEAIMRPDVNPNPNAADRARLRRYQSDKVY
jgi:hypothetical protein